MTEVEQILDQGCMIETEESILHSVLDPEVTIIQGYHTEDKTTMEIDVTMDNRGLKSNPDCHLEDLGLHQSL